MPPSSACLAYVLREKRLCFNKKNRERRLQKVVKGLEDMNSKGVGGLYVFLTSFYLTPVSF